MLSGSIVALVTPFTSQDEVDYEKIKKLMDFQYQNQTENLLILGTTAESPTLTDIEKEKIVQTVISYNQNRMKIVVGISENKTLSAVIKAQKYASLGADYLLVLTPFYNKGNQQGIIQHFQLVAESVKIPLVLYNIPNRTGVNLDVNMIKKLKKIPNIIGVKEANRDINHLLDIYALCDDNFSLYCGNDDLLLVFKALKAKGYFNVYGNINPQAVHKLIANDELFCKHYPLLKGLFLETNPIPIKALMNYQGFNVGAYRLPLCEMADENYQKLLDTYRKIPNISLIN